MSTWTSDLELLAKPPELHERYVLRPRKEGAIVYCTTCTRVFGQASDSLTILASEAQEHEGINHPERK